MIEVVVVVKKERRGAFSVPLRVPSSVMVGIEVQTWESISSFWFYRALYPFSAFSISHC